MEIDFEQDIVRRRSPVFRLRLLITDPTLFEERFRLTPTQAEKLLRLLGTKLC